MNDVTAYYDFIRTLQHNATSINYKKNERVMLTQV